MLHLVLNKHSSLSVFEIRADKMLFVRNDFILQTLWIKYWLVAEYKIVASDTKCAPEDRCQSGRDHCVHNVSS